MRETDKLDRVVPTFPLSDRDTACFVLHVADAGWFDHNFDYDEQLIAIRELLVRHRIADNELNTEIERLSELAKATHNEHVIDEQIAHVQSSVYQNAAHSMAAAGVIATFVESVFRRALLGIDHLVQNGPVQDGYPYRLWKDILKGVVRKGMMRHMLGDLEQTLSALFLYRNKMLHYGFEWPIKERRDFNSRLKDWPSDWFSRATSGDVPWVFSMSVAFMEHCLVRADKIIDGIEEYCQENGVYDAAVDQGYFG